MKRIFPRSNDCTVAVIGLGYVGLPLAVEFARPQDCSRTGVALQRRVIGFDINSERLEELRLGIDRTNETSSEELKAAQLLEFTSDSTHLADADVFVVTVPTPIDSAKRPDLTPLEKASATVGRVLKKRRSATTPVVIYESTVYPGATEEVCVPILEQESGLLFNEGFCCGYSPERINPGDSQYKLSDIVKVTSGSTPDASLWIDSFYSSIIQAGTHLAPSIKVAEAAKVIENTQRDLNIALVNELAVIFKRMNIDTLDVLAAAGTKWNFLPFSPGLVGGHCIGVDPYYLTHKAEQLGYHPQVVLAGRRINDSMASWVVDVLVKNMCNKGLIIAGASVLIKGFAFKENCPDIRNTRVYDLVKSLQSFDIQPTIVDPCIQLEDAWSEYKLRVLASVPDNSKFDAVIVAVPHDEYSDLPTSYWLSLVKRDGLLFDLKGILPRELNAIRL